MNLRAQNLFTYAGKCFFTILAATASPVYAKQVTVRRGETVSQIVQHHLGRPVYGKKGRLREVQGLNPQIKNLDLVEPGDVINLPGEEAKKEVVSEVVAVPQVVPESSTAQPNTAPPSPPLSIPVDEDKSDSKRDSLTTLAGMFFEINFGETKIELDSRDDKITTVVRSNINQGATFGYQHGLQLLNRETALGFSFQGVNAEIEDSKDGVIVGSSHLLKSILVTTASAITPNLTLGINFGTEQQFVLSKKSEQVVGDAVFQDVLYAHVKYGLIAGKTWQTSLLAHLGKRFAGDGPLADPEQGLTYGAGLQYDRQLSQRLIGQVKVLYHRRSLNNTDFYQKNEERSIVAGVRFVQ